MYMQAPDTERKIQQLAECGPLKAWSVIVSVLGDFCVARHDSISGRDLNALIERIGLTAPTMRVALHRLKRDGWIQTEKKGRDAAYRLSAMGWRETQAVRGRIYATGQPPVGTAQMILAPPSVTAADFTSALPKTAAALAPRTAILAGPATGLPADYWLTPLDPGTAPAWVADAVAAPELRRDYARLTEAVTDILTATPPQDSLSLSAVRVLTLHHWRRLRLRHDDLPDILLGEDWEGARARHIVMTALDRFPRPAPGDLAA
jgi:phenylacetic acid degradation operon negative regulatory protein